MTFVQIPLKVGVHGCPRCQRVSKHSKKSSGRWAVVTFNAISVFPLDLEGQHTAVPDQRIGAWSTDMLSQRACHTACCFPNVLARRTAYCRLQKPGSPRPPNTASQNGPENRPCAHDRPCPVHLDLLLSELQRLEVHELRQVHELLLPGCPTHARPGQRRRRLSSRRGAQFGVTTVHANVQDCGQDCG